MLDDILLSARLDGSLNGLSDDSILYGSLNGLSDDAFLNSTPDGLLDDTLPLNTLSNSTLNRLLDDTLLNSTPDGLLDDTFFNGSLNGLLDDTLPLDTPLDGLLLGDGSLSLRCYLIRVSSRLSFPILHSQPPLVIVTVLTLVLVPS
ncbi:hypothetical protein ACFQE8_22785 [Salinirubellus sp. GCM10025818]|uniref:hypothetical protein n=1 Tax=Salinirubellus TaxID=2162630 RepID=UPI00360E1C3D